MIMKLLVLGLVIYIVYIMFFKTKKVSDTKTEQSKSKADAEVNDLIRCESCGVYMELEDAIVSNGKYYCSRECLQRA